VPCTIVYRKDKVVEGTTNPMLLSGYGAYGDIRMPTFNSDLRSLLDRGVIYGIAHVRVKFCVNE
jgi:oligopeptidase B